MNLFILYEFADLQLVGGEGQSETVCKRSRSC